MSLRLFACLFFAHAAFASSAAARTDPGSPNPGLPASDSKAMDGPANEGSKGTATDKAAALFKKGRDAFERRDYEAACEAFAWSLKWEAAPGTALNLAACEESRNHLARAFQNWNLALELLDPTDPRYSYALLRKEDLTPRVPRLHILVEARAPTHSVVKHQGKPIRLGEVTLMDPGKHQLFVSAPGHEQRKYELYLAAGQHQRLIVQPGPLVAKRDSRRRTQTILGSTLIGLGASGALSAIVTSAMLEGQRKRFETHCDPECDDEGREAAKRGRKLLTVNTASWIAGTLGLVGGSVLLFTRPNGHGVRDASLSLSPHKAALQLRGTF